MRTSILSSPATRALCAACRNEASRTNAGVAFSTACASKSSNRRPESRPRVTTTTTTTREIQKHRLFPSARAYEYSTSSTPSDNTSPEPQPPNSSTSSSDSNKPIPRYYALFPITLPLGPPPSGPFDIDIRALRREFLRLQAASHPDFHHSANQFDTNSSNGNSDESLLQRRKAEATSSLINSAYKTLSSPLLRAQYLLKELYDVDLAGDESTDYQNGSDPTLLMMVLEAREQIDEAKTEADLEPVREENEARMRESEEKLSEAFAKEDVEAATRECVKLRYWMGIREGCNEWEEGKGFVMHH
ncbi:Co-chaperone Hsc20 [Neurospora tetrasperma FGSC 2509]|nr:Co-chaperone Hsc20 [Neurospora tetrasperma FGSC 2509]